MDLLQMDYFVHVAESATMQQAAEQLNVSPSTLSMSIKKLENELGTPLFLRAGHKLSLTEEGRLLHEGASRILFEVENLKLRIRSRKDSHRNALIIATDAADYAAETVYIYSKLRPEISVEHIRMRHNAMRALLSTGQADLSITLQPVIDDSIESTLLLSEPMYLLASHDSPYAAMEHVRMRDLLQETLICLPRGHALRDLFESYFSMLGFAPRSILEVGELDALSMSARKRFGITFVPQCVQGSEDFFKGLGYQVCTRPIQESFCYRNLYLSRPKNAPDRPELQEYIRFLHCFNDLVVQLKRFPSQEECSNSL